MMGVAVVEKGLVSEQEWTSGTSTGLPCPDCKMEIRHVNAGTFACGESVSSTLQGWFVV